MLEVVREGRDYLINTLGLRRRLAMRVGALMAQHIAFTATVLEEAREDENLARLILSRELHEAGDNLETVLQELMSRDEYADLAEEVPLAVSSRDDWQIIALTEELEAEQGFQESSTDKSDTPVTAPAKSSSPAASRSLVPAVGGELILPGTLELGGTAAAFSEERVAELRVSVFAGASSAERVSALRKIGFAPMPEAEQAAIFIQALGEEDSALRAAAANGLHALGLDGSVTEALRLLAEGNDEERIYACQRLEAIAGEDSQFALRAAVMALLGTLRVEEAVPVRQAAVRPLGILIPEVAGFDGASDEIMRLLIEQVVGEIDRMGSVVRNVLMAFEDARPGKVASYMLAEAEHTTSLPLRAYLLGLAISCKVPEELADKLRVLAVEAVMELPAESSQAHPLANYLIRTGDAGVRALLEQLNTTDVGHQRFLVRRLDSAVRFGNLSAEVLIELARIALRLLQSGSKQLLADIFETWLATPSNLPAKMRDELAMALVRGARQFAMPQIIDNIENSLVRLGPGALAPLLEIIRESPGHTELLVTVRAMGRLARESVAHGEQYNDILRESLRTLQAMSFKENVAREVFVALGQICSTGAVSADGVEVVRRNLLNRLQGNTSDAPMVEALGWIVSAPDESEENIIATAELALTHLERPTPDSTIQMEIQDGDEIFRFGGEFDVFSELIPGCLRAIRHILILANLPAPRREEMVQRLLACWKLCINFEMQWSPGNVSELTSVLGQVGESPAISKELRIEIIHTLSARMSDIPVLEALAGVVAASGPAAEFDRLAAAVALRVLRYMEEDRDLTHEDREIYLGVLGRVVARGKFEVRGGGGERLLRRVLDEVILGLRDGIAGTLRMLMELQDNSRLPENLRDRVVETVRNHTALTHRH